MQYFKKLKINLLKFAIVSFFITTIPINLANAQIAENIRIGFSGYQNYTSIPIGFNNNSSSITLKFATNENLNNSITLGAGENLLTKAVKKYTILSSVTYGSYSEAKSYANTLQDATPYLIGTRWHIAEGSFGYESQAEAFLNGSNDNKSEEEEVYSSKMSQGTVELTSNSIGVYIDNKLAFMTKDSIYIRASDDLFSLGNNNYRNILQINCSSNLLDVINLVNIEEYLYSVVPNEMPASWNKEALKAQAIACRNFAVSNMNVHIKDGYNICNTSHCQVYYGYDKEHENSTSAVNETKGIYAYYNNEVINAVYSSSNGGYSENSEDVWYDEIPYLKAVADEDENAGSEWTRTFTFKELSNLANVGDVKEVQIDVLTESDRVLNLILVGTNGTKTVEKDEIRTFFYPTSEGSLYSKNFEIVGATNNLRDVVSATFVKDEIFEVFNVFAVISKSGEEVIQEVEISLEEIEVVSLDNKEVAQTKFAINYAGDIHKLEYNNGEDNLENDFEDNNVEDNNTEDDDNILNEDVFEGNLTPKDIVRKVITSENTSTLTFNGSGWGHGVGMSQYGANALANKGYTYEEILKYYYTDIDVK